MRAASGHLQSDMSCSAAGDSRGVKVGAKWPRRHGRAAAAHSWRGRIPPERPAPPLSAASLAPVGPRYQTAVRLPTEGVRRGCPTVCCRRRARRCRHAPVPPAARRLALQSSERSMPMLRAREHTGLPRPAAKWSGTARGSAEPPPWSLKSRRDANAMRPGLCKGLRGHAVGVCIPPPSSAQRTPPLNLVPDLFELVMWAVMLH